MTSLRYRFIRALKVAGEEVCLAPSPSPRREQGLHASRRSTRYIRAHSDRQKRTSLLPPSNRRDIILAAGEHVENRQESGAPQSAEQRLKTRKMTIRMLASFIHQDGIAGVPVR